MGLLGLLKIDDPTLKAPPPAVVVSRIPPEEQSLQPAETALCAAIQAAAIPFTLVDSIYDQRESDAGVAFLRSLRGDLIFLGWQYPRALKWILARQDLEVNGVHRRLHCLDVRAIKPEAAAELVRKILNGQASAEVIAKQSPEAARLAEAAQRLSVKQRAQLGEQELAPPANAKLSPRWYPVIDYDQCTNCMDCLDFCLFGVYGVDHQATLRVVQQDQCRQDCPACARVCPVGAIVFPKYQTNQTIAGSADVDGDRGSLKLDLSKIFGKPKARHQAALERDRELLKAGRQPAGAEKIEKLGEAFEKLEL